MTKKLSCRMGLLPCICCRFLDAVADRLLMVLLPMEALVPAAVLDDACGIQPPPALAVRGNSLETLRVSTGKREEKDNYN